MALAVLVHAQAGPCTEDAIKQDKVTVADDVFMYMTPFGKAVIGKSAAKETSGKKFEGRTNIQRSWVDEHRIVSSASADMAYEYGTMGMSYDSKDRQPHKFQAVILEVYKSKDGVCKLVAETMEPLSEAKDSASTERASDEQAIRRINDEWLKASDMADAATLDRIETEDFTVSGAFGQTTKQQQLDMVRNHSWKPQTGTLKIENQQFRFYGDVALVTEIDHWSGAEKVSDYQSTTLWRRDGNAWKAVHLHYSALAKKP
jgi:ketosteroid isomerase-like protein